MECSLILTTVFILIFFSSATQASPGASNLANTGFALSQGASSNIEVPAGWGGRIWVRTFCGTRSGRFKCLTGDCGTGQVSCNGNGGATPASLAEIQLNGVNNDDYYDVSLVDGFNLPVTVSPQRGGCPNPGCTVDINAICPTNLTIGGSNGRVIGCRSDPQLFKSVCPQAYATNLNDQSTYSCTTGEDYLITFCPDPSTQHYSQPQYLGMLCIL